MNDENEARIWRGLREHLDALGHLAPAPDLAAVRNRSSLRSPSAPLRSIAGMAAAGVFLVILAGQVGLIPRALLPGASTLTVPNDLYRQAQGALARWARAAADAKNGGVVIVGELTGLIGAWEEPVGDNNKIAVMSGAVEAPAGLPTAAPPPGEVRWSNGTSQAVALLSADDALQLVVASAKSTCSHCSPVQITSAQLATGSVETSRGAATAPVWEFSVRGSAVKITRVAIAEQISVTPPPWDPYDPPQGISIDSAVGTPQSRELTVSFAGVPDGPGPCATDYTAEAVESDVAVVVIVIEHRVSASQGTSRIDACGLVTADRTAGLTLSAPLGGRVVLEVKEGLPVAVRAP